MFTPGFHIASESLSRLNEALRCRYCNPTELYLKFHLPNESWQYFHVNLNVDRITVSRYSSSPFHSITNAFKYFFDRDSLNQVQTYLTAKHSNAFKIQTTYSVRTPRDIERRSTFYEICIQRNNNDESRIPETSIEWIVHAAEKASIHNPELTLLLDLDETVVHYGTNPLGRFNKPFKFTKSFTEKTIYYDADALRQVKLLQKRGHKVVVITNAPYLKEDVTELFKKVEIKLDQKNFYNRNTEGRNRKDKASYIRFLKYGRRSLLIDDIASNCPSSVHYAQATLSRFPELTLIQ